MKKLMLAILLQALLNPGYSQVRNRLLSFTAINIGTHVILDSVKIYSANPGSFEYYTMIAWPDTAGYFDLFENFEYLFIGYSGGIPVGTVEPELTDEVFWISRSYPNPARGQSQFSINVPHPGFVLFRLIDLSGRTLLQEVYDLDQGFHHFVLYPGNENTYLLSASWNGERQTISIITMNSALTGNCYLRYSGQDELHITDYKKSPGEENSVMKSGILDIPDSDTVYTFQFASGIPCPGTLSVDYEGKEYNTIQIFSQCWLKENMDVGVMKLLAEEVSNDSIIEKRCYDDNIDSCLKYGGLYEFDEALGYSYEPSTRGICPPGWHIPTDLEWIVLESLADSIYPVDDPSWFWTLEMPRGFDAGKNLKSFIGWVEGNGTDDIGFSALPGGEISYHIMSPIYENIGYVGKFASSKSIDPWNMENDIYDRHFWVGPNIRRYQIEMPVGLLEKNGYSVRCLQDY